MTIPDIRCATAHLSDQQPLTDQLATAHNGLEVVENALRGLARLALPGRLPYLARAQSQAGAARASLVRAPSLFWPFGSPPTGLALEEAEETTVLVELLELADTLVLSLVESADQADDSRDEAACIRASVQACLLTKTLGRALQEQTTGNAV